MKTMMRLVFLASLACLMMVAAGCASKVEQPMVQGGGEGLIDSGLPVLNAEEGRAADELTNAKVYFAFDRFDLASESQRLLTRKAQLLKQYTKIKVSIQGNCDERGTEEYNLALGERRARAAQEFLILNGVSPTQIEIVSYGKLRPAVPGTGEAVWAKNRRDEFVVLNPRSR